MLNKNVISVIMLLESVGTSSGDPQIAQDVMTKASQLGPNKLSLVSCHLGELPKRFKPFLKLSDFS